METKDYIVTKEECQKKIDELNHVCDYCGRDLQPIETVDIFDNPTHWIGCFHGSSDGCGQFTYGVPKEVFELSRKLVLSDVFSFKINIITEWTKTKEDIIYRINQETSRICNMYYDVKLVKEGKINIPTEEEFINKTLKYIEGLPK